MPGSSISSGENRYPIIKWEASFSATTCWTFVKTSIGNRVRFSRLPPHESCLRLECGEKNCCNKYVLAPWISTPSNPASIARRVASPKSSIIWLIWACVISLGGTASGLNAAMGLADIGCSPSLNLGFAILPAW